MALVFIALLVIIAVAVLVYALSGSEKKITGFTITDDAKRVFREYIRTHPDAAKKESGCSGISDLASRIEDYFAIELTEEDHRDVLEAVRKNNGVFTAPMMERWRDENYREIYIENKPPCN